MIDLGPTGGEDGGELMGQSTPGQIIGKKTATGLELKKFLN